VARWLSGSNPAGSESLGFYIGNLRSTVRERSPDEQRHTPQIAPIPLATDEGMCGGHPLVNS
jgi:hypothetical protein